MSRNGNIQYLRHDEINKERWDACITHSPGGLIYAYSFYLDSFAPGWDALVAGNYESVMPLTYNKKFGIRYLYQPFITAQLGVFSTRPEDDSAAFIREARHHFRYIDISLNSSNKAAAALAEATFRNNYILQLNKSYEEISQAYADNLRRNIRKAEQAGCRLIKEFDAEKVIRLAVAQMKQQGHDPGVNPDRFRKLYHLLTERKMATTYGIVAAGDELLSSCIFFFSHHRAYYILVGNNPAGKETGASHLLIDAFIRDHAGKNMVLDFEGSDIPGLARFYSSYGATNEPYPAIKINRLPFFLKWLKK